MQLSLNTAHEIKPAAPDSTVRGLLTLSAARTLPLSGGNLHSYPGRAGTYLVVAVTQGSLTITSHAQYALLDDGQAYVLSGDSPCTIQAVSDCLCILIQLQGGLAGRLLEGYLPGTLFPRGAPPVREAVLALFVLEEEHPTVSGELASSYAYTMLIKLRGIHAAANTPSSPLVEEAISIIQEEFPFLSGLDELAERLEVSKAHLSRSFSQKVGISPGKYIVRVKIEYAKLLLQDEDVSISYVAEASGFANANYFAKVFRKETGMSPTEYLQSAPKRERRPLRLEGNLAMW